MMAKNKKGKPRAMIERATAPPKPAKVPKKETVVIHTETRRERERNAGLGDGLIPQVELIPIMPLLGSLGGAAAAVYADKLGIGPKWASGITAVGGTMGAMGTHGRLRELLTGVACSGTALATMQAIFALRADAARREAEQAAKKADDKTRKADGADGFITRQELNDALVKVVDAHNDALVKVADAHKQQSCDLLSSLDELRKIVVERQKASTPSQHPIPPNLWMGSEGAPTRGAGYDDEERDAGPFEIPVEERDADGYAEYETRDAIPVEDGSDQARDSDPGDDPPN
jgi:hypothetical protein